MLMQMQEMIAFNFNLLSNDDYQKIPTGLATLRENCEVLTWRMKTKRGGGPVINNPRYVAGFERRAREVVSLIDGIAEECRKAQYYYLKGALQDFPVPEIDADEKRVEDGLSRLGFSSELVKSLRAAEHEYRTASNEFELKNCLGHLRSFLEHLHRQAAKSLAEVFGDPLEDSWGSATYYMRSKGVYSLKHEEFSTRLYTLVSDTSIHALGAERDYARLLRNMIVEYGVMFLSAIEKHRVKP